METERPIIRPYGGPFGYLWWLVHSTGELGLHPEDFGATDVFWARV